MIRSRSASATAERYFSRPMLASTVTDEDTSWKPAGEVKQYGEPVGEMTVPEHLSWVRPRAAGALADGVGLPAPGFTASAATVPLPGTVVAQPASRPHRPSRTAAKRR